MPPSTRARASLLAAALLAMAAGTAAEAQASAKVRFLAERVPDGLGEVVLISGENATTPFALTVNNLSAEIEAPARGFTLGTAKEKKKLAAVNLPEEGRSFVILLVPDPAGGYRAASIRADSPDFKGGDVYLFNHSDKQVLGFVGTAKFLLKPGQGQVLRPAGLTEGGYYDVAMGVREDDGSNRTLSQTRWPEDPRARSYVFFFVNPVTTRIDFRAVDEVVPATRE